MPTDTILQTVAEGSIPPTGSTAIRVYAWEGPGTSDKWYYFDSLVTNVMSRITPAAVAPDSTYVQDLLASTTDGGARAAILAASSADLTSLTATLKALAFTGSIADLIDASANGRTLIAAADYTAMRGLLEVDAAVDARVAALDVQIFKGVINASANPNYPAADAGNLYRISVAGKIGGASGPNVEVGDMILALADGIAAGNHATVGASWSILQTNLDGAVIGPASATDAKVAGFNGTSGKVIDELTAAEIRTAAGLGTLATQSGTFSGTSSGTNTGDQTSVTGNAGTATTLQNTRTINGVNFNGGANISVNATSGTPADLASTAALGSSALAAKSDHVHKAPGATKATATLGSNYTLTGGAAVYTDTGLSIVLPTIGTYDIFTLLSVAMYAGYIGFYVRFYNSTTATVIQDFSLRLDNFQNDSTYTPQIEYTTTATNQTVKLYVAEVAVPATRGIVRAGSILRARLASAT